MSEKTVQTAGREQLGEFAPMFAHLNDDVLFGEVWNADGNYIIFTPILSVQSQPRYWPLVVSGCWQSHCCEHRGYS